MRSVGSAGAYGELAHIIRAGSDNGATLTKAVVVSVESGGTLTAYVEGSTVATPNIRYLNTVHPVVGAHVWIIKEGGVWLAFGSSAPASIIAAYVRRGTTQSITDNATGGLQAVEFNSSIEKTDPTGMYANANPTRLTVPVTGFYSFSASGAFNGNATGYREFTIGVNGTAVAVSRLVTTGSAQPTYGTVGLAAYPLTAGDYLEFLVRQNSGGALNLSATTATPSMQVVYLGSSGA